MTCVVFRRPDGPIIKIKVAEIASIDAVPPKGHPNRGFLEEGTRIRLSCGRMQDVQELLPEVTAQLALYS